ncbi:MAG: phosphotransferase [Nocardioides sp.]|uniref:phosphotransferase n=1 Tax=Nocardioides sp. TaxID=35761 RepID=UPI003267034F
MWQPEPGWQRLPGGTSPSAYGVWLTIEGDREAIVKRLRAPVEGDEPELSDWHSFAWWEREPQVALHGLVAATNGLRGPVTLRVDDDDEGTTLMQERVPEADNPGLFVARALGRFARTPVPDEPWLARGQLRERLSRIERRGGWQTLARTTLADVADHLWRHRVGHLDALDAAPQVLQHGDPTPANLRGRDVDDVIAIDWSALGTGAVGHDLGLWALAAREDFDPLLAAYVDGLADPTLADAAAAGARVTAVYTSLSRLDWALRRVADGEGALAGKYSHPSVAPYVHSMQRQAAQIEALLG